MKSFKDFLKGTIKPIIVDVLPVHGSHAQEKKKPKERSKLKENFEDEEHQKLHLGYSLHDHLDKHKHSDDSWKHLNHGYKPTKHELSHERYKWDNREGHQVTNEIREYTSSSRTLNHSLINHATGLKPSSLQSHAKYKQLAKEQGHYHIDSAKEHRENKNHLKIKINRLDHALKKSKLKEPLKVMTGVGFNPDHYAAQHPERHIHLPAYTSSSVSSRIAKAFGSRSAKSVKDEDGRYVEHSHILRIHLPKGHKALHVLHKSDLPHEHEVILPRNMKLKVAENPYHVEHQNSYGDRIIHHYWDAHPVKDTKTK